MKNLVLPILVSLVLGGIVLEVNAGRGRSSKVSGRTTRQSCNKEAQKLVKVINGEDSEEDSPEVVMTEAEAKALSACVYFYSIKEYDKAFEIAEKLAKEFNNAKAFYLLGLMYKNGFGVEKDSLRAYDHLKVAITRGKCIEAIEDILEITDDVIEELRLRPVTADLSMMYM